MYTLKASRDYLRITIDGIGTILCETENVDMFAPLVVTLGSATVTRAFVVLCSSLPHLTTVTQRHVFRRRECQWWDLPLQVQAMETGSAITEVLVKARAINETRENFIFGAWEWVL